MRRDALGRSLALITAAFALSSTLGCIESHDSSVWFHRHPSDRTATAGGVATFSVVVMGVGTLSYQWQKSEDGGASWSDIDGASGANCTVERLRLADSGALFRCLATNGTDSVFSAAALLTVVRPLHRITFRTDGTEGARLEVAGKNVGGTYVEDKLQDGDHTALVRAVAPAGYLFGNWTHAETGEVFSFDETVSVEDVGDSMTLVARFGAETTLTMSVIGGLGTTFPTAGVHSVPTGLPVRISAFPMTKNDFLRWEATAGDAVVSAISSKSATVTLDGPATVAARFAWVTFVDASATGLNNGTSWANAHTDLRSVMNSLSSGVIWVAAGTYYPTTSPTNRHASFPLKSGVAVYGGFAGWESFRDQRDWPANETILSGDINRTGDLTGNTQNLVNCSTSSDESTVLDGFTLTMGHNQYFSGAGIFVAGRPILRNLFITGNHSVNQGGGAFVNIGGHAPTFINCTFYRNSARWQGGGASSRYSFPKFIDCKFIENYSEGGGGAGFNSWGGQPVLIGCEFIRNTTADGRGGGASFLDGSEPLLVNCLFHSNASGHAGGAIVNRPANPTIINCTISGNTAAMRHNVAGGGMQNLDSDTVLTEPLIINTVVWGNRALWRTEIDGKAGEQVASHIGGGDPLFENAPLFEDRTRETGPDASTAVFASSDGFAVDDVIEVDFDSVARTVTGIDGNAVLFFPALDQPVAAHVSVRNWGRNASDFAVSYRLTADSPCVDAGVNAPFEVEGQARGLGVSTDLDGNPRVFRGMVDIGAYEFRD